MYSKSICSILALTAAVSQADKLSLAQLLNLQTSLVDHLDLGHTEPEVDHRGDSEHIEHIEHWNEMDLGHTEPEVDYTKEHMEHTKHWNDVTTFHELDLGSDEHCPVGYALIGCCKCIRDIHAAEHHLTGGHYGEDDEPVTIHGEHYQEGNDYRGQMYGGRHLYDDHDRDHGMMKGSALATHQGMAAEQSSSRQVYGGEESQGYR